MNADKNDMVAIVAHMVMIASRRRGEQMSSFMPSAFKIMAAMCVLLELDGAEVAMLASQQADAMRGALQ